MDNTRIGKSDRESGDGRHDRKKGYPGIIMELKRSMDYDQLQDLAFAALSRFDNLRYDTELRETGGTIRKFSGKKVVKSLIKCFQGPEVLIPCKC